MHPRQVAEVVRVMTERDPMETCPILIWGPPGIGKSAVIAQIAREKNLEFRDIRLAQRDPTDLRGIPVVATEWYCRSCGKNWFSDPTKIENGQIVAPNCCETAVIVKRSSARWLAPSDLPKAGKGILFADELTSAPPLNQAAMYQLILDRQLGEYHLPDGWYLIGAGNRMEDRAVVYRQSTALMNRFTHINMEASPEDWQIWALRHNIHPDVIAFLQFQANLLAPGFNKESSENAFPSPRTWEYVSRWLIAGLAGPALNDILDGTIGKGASLEFVQFLKVKNDLPDPNRILEKGENVKLPENRMDLKYAMVSTLAARAKGQKHFENLVQYSRHLPIEFGILLCTLLISKDEQTLAKCPSFEKWAIDHADVIAPIVS